jgi:hypothetical protein
MLQPFPSFLDVSRSLAGRMRDEAELQRARRAVGCVDVATCADLVDPGRVNIFGALGVAGGAWTLSAAAALTRNSAWLCTGCTFRSTTSSTLAVFGEGAEWIARTDAAATDEIGAAVGSHRTATNPARREPRP